jgi:hypothetical protein
MNLLRARRPAAAALRAVAGVAVLGLAAAGCHHVATTASVTPRAPSSPAVTRDTWKQAGTSHVNSLTGAEGLASRPSGALLHRGLGSVPLHVREQGWKHVGDPDIADGDIFDAYQGAASRQAIMFAVTTAGGKRLEYTHTLSPGELFNNSFDAVSPDGQWLVAGEFGLQKRLLVFPAPLLNHSTPPGGGALPGAGQITLSTTVRNVQGCDFVTATELICSANDVAKDVFRVTLPHPLNGQVTTGQVTTVFQIPRVSHCRGRFEAEGLDFDTATQVLRVQIVPPGVCKVTTDVIAYHRTA